MDVGASSVRLLCGLCRSWLLEVGISTDPTVLLVLDATDDQRDPVVVPDKRGTSWQHLCNGHGLMLKKRGASDTELVALTPAQFVSRLSIEFPDAGTGASPAAHLYRSGRLSVDLRTMSVKSPLETIACWPSMGVWKTSSGASLVYKRFALLVLNSDALTPLQAAKLRAVRSSVVRMHAAMIVFVDALCECGTVLLAAARSSSAYRGRHDRRR